MAIRVSGAKDLEFRVRESGNQLFVIAAKREGETAEVTFSGLPEDVRSGTLLYEEPRKVIAKSGSFTAELPSIRGGLPEASSG